MIIREVVPTELSGQVGSLTQIMITFGRLTAYLIAYILKKATGDHSCYSFWPAVFGLTLFSILIQSGILLLVIPIETPKYYLLNNQ